MRFLVVSLVICVLAFSAAGQALACSCTQEAFSPEASKRNVARAIYIVEGAVINVTPNPPTEDQRGLAGLSPSRNPNFAKIEVKIGNLLKGGETETFSAYADVRTSCGTTPENLPTQKFFVVYSYRGDFVVGDHCGSYISPEDRVLLGRGIYPK